MKSNFLIVHAVYCIHVLEVYNNKTHKTHFTLLLYFNILILNVDDVKSGRRSFGANFSVLRTTCLMSPEMRPSAQVMHFADEYRNRVKYLIVESTYFSTHILGSSIAALLLISQLVE